MVQRVAGILYAAGLVLILVPLGLYAAVMSDMVPLEIKGPASESPWQRYPSWPQDRWEHFSNLARAEPGTMSQLLHLEGPVQGDPNKGKMLVGDRERGGSCFACHIFPGAELPGNVGPNLSTIGVSGRSDEFLFNYIFDPRSLNPDSVMPPWGAHGVFSREEIQDMVAYLKTLTEPTPFRTDQDDPSRRGISVPEIDNLDEFENPAMFLVAEGESLYTDLCGACHEDRARFRVWATAMPQYERRLGKILGVEEFITRHVRATTDAELTMEGAEVAALSVYLRYLANGERINVDTADPDTLAALRRGEALTRSKVGQLNFACADCHQIAARRWIRGNYLPGMESMINHFPIYRTSRGEVWDIRKRMQWCNVSIRANELPPDAPEYGDIELYLTKRANGQKLSVPGIGH